MALTRVALERFAKLAADGYLGEMLTLAITRDILAHRGITQQDVASACALPLHLISRHITGEDLERHRIGPNGFQRRQLEVENAITKITDERGYLCECTPESLQDMVRYLDRHPITREVKFGRASA